MGLFASYPPFTDGIDPSGGQASAAAAMENAGGSGAAAAQQFQNFGLTMQAAGMITQSIGAYYQAKMAQHEARSKASSMRFKAEMAGINASIARDNAGSIREAGQYAKAQLTMRAGMEMAKSLTRQGARGITMGVGSAAESMASEELIKDMDAFTVDSNTMRQAQAQEMQSVNLRNQGLLAGVSARNLERSASSIDPGGAAFTSLIGGASRVGMNIGSVMAYRNQA